MVLGVWLVVEMVSTAVYVGVLFGTLNSTIPNLSDVESDSKDFWASCITEDIKLYLDSLSKGLVLNVYDVIVHELLGGVVIQDPRVCNMV